jgi:hypothetical protein
MGNVRHVAQGCWPVRSISIVWATRRARVPLGLNDPADGLSEVRIHQRLDPLVAQQPRPPLATGSVRRRRPAEGLRRPNASAWAGALPAASLPEPESHG